MAKKLILAVALLIISLVFIFSGKELIQDNFFKGMSIMDGLRGVLGCILFSSGWLIVCFPVQEEFKWVLLDTEKRVEGEITKRCWACSPDGTVGFPDGCICDVCGGSGELIIE